MRALRLRWRERDTDDRPKPPPGLIDASILDPVILGELPDDSLYSTIVRIGSTSYEIGDLFETYPLDAKPGPLLVLEGVPSLWRLGGNLSRGWIDVEGPGGSCLGSRMTGGQITLDGDAGDLLGAEMRGGLITCRGSAGDRVGGALLGSTRGMRGGEIVISGDAGSLVGHRMRRGLIAVRGSVGQFPGHAMIAGTIVIGDGELDRAGLAMSRGTVISLSTRTEPSPGFESDGPTRPLFWRVLARRLLDLDAIVDESLIDASFDAYRGDPQGIGKGELLIRR